MATGSSSSWIPSKKMWSSTNGAGAFGQRSNIASLPTTLLNNNDSGRASSWFYQPLSTNSNDQMMASSSSNTINDTNNVGDNLSRSSSWASFLPFMGQREQPIQRPWYSPNLTLSTTQKLICFVTLLGSGLSCFLISTMYIPLLLFKARKFCIFFTMGSLLVMTSFAFLFGPMSHLRHLFSRDRLPFTLAYVGSLSGTLFVSMHLQSTILTIIFVVIQIVSLIWYFMSYLPHGNSSMKFVASMLTRSVSSTLPI